MTRRHPVSSLIGAALVAAALGGCGLQAATGAGLATVTVTRNFGSRPIGTASQGHVPGSESVLRLLERSFTVATRTRADDVQTIDGLSDGAAQGDWYYFVNGIAAASGAAKTDVHGGDAIWWDHHDQSAAGSIPAVIGSFPEPFTHGTGGRRFPTVLECAQDVPAACRRVASELKRVGVPVATQLLGGGSGTDSLAIVVGTWSDLRGVIATDLVERGPQSSGVYGQFVGTAGQAIELDDPNGSVVRTLHGEAGMIAATEQPGLNEPAWLITGTDRAGVDEAADALTPAKLHDCFAVAVVGGHVLGLPLDPDR